MYKRVGNIMQSNNDIQTHPYCLSTGDMERRTMMHKIYTATDPLTMLFSPMLEAALEQVEVWLARRERRDCERRDRVRRARQAIQTALSAAA